LQRPKPYSMYPRSKGIYPSWVNDNDIINQILREILEENGRLPYANVIKSNQNLGTQKRIKDILSKMAKEGLIVHSRDNDHLEFGEEGVRAVNIGYRRYKNRRKWNFLSRIQNSMSSILLVALSVMFVFLILRFLR